MRIDEHVLFDSLFDVYGGLLTERQYKVVYLHIREDFSLSEIAEELNITKQAVSDALNTARAKLEDYEQKLHMLAVSEKLERLVDALKHEKNIPEAIKAQAEETAAMMKNSEEEQYGI